MYSKMNYQHFAGATMKMINYGGNSPVLQQSILLGH